MVDAAVSDPAESRTRPNRISGKLRSEILREAINATGGPESDTLASAKNYVDRKYSSYPWSRYWHAEINGAKAALQCPKSCVDSSAPTTNVSATVEIPEQPESSPASEYGPAVTGEDIQRAQTFIREIGEGSVDKAAAALEFLLDFGSLSRMQPGLDGWSQLLAAVDGNPEFAQRVVDVVAEHLLPQEYPRLAENTLDRNAA